MEHGILAFIPQFEKDKYIMKILKHTITQFSSEDNPFIYEDNEEREKRQEVLKFIKYLEFFNSLSYYPIIFRFIQEVEELHSYMLSRVNEEEDFEIDPEDYKEFHLFNKWIQYRFLKEEIEEDVLKKIHNESA